MVVLRVLPVLEDEAEDELEVAVPVLRVLLVVPDEVVPVWRAGVWLWRAAV